ncbi:hypothetical protein H5410_004439 [Solanum commersonii]|uniref:Uncharacterized protein n=1 Tax=Solanum commersonii TaxID=4109 RepID=A0A9J6B809_SOLCO|nr:hypothetical protein H5410_004439 [Solanum commersonii]
MSTMPLPLLLRLTTLVPIFLLLITIGFLVDSKNGEVVYPLCGHVDYLFESSWHSNGLTFASGNKYKCVKYGIFKNLSKSVTTLKGNLGAIWSICYMSN